MRKAADWRQHDVMSTRYRHHPQQPIDEKHGLTQLEYRKNKYPFPPSPRTVHRQRATIRPHDHHHIVLNSTAIAENILSTSACRPLPAI
jgi:hypothetical protein